MGKNDGLAWPPVFLPEWGIQCKRCVNRDQRLVMGPHCAKCVFAGRVDMERLGKEPLMERDYWEFYNWGD